MILKRRRRFFFSMSKSFRCYVFTEREAIEYITVVTFLQTKPFERKSKQLNSDLIQTT